MTINSNERFLKQSGLWEGYTLYDLYKEAGTPYEWHEELFNYAKNIANDIFQSFDEDAADFLGEVLCI